MEKYELVVLPVDITLCHTHSTYTYIKFVNENKINYIPGHFFFKYRKLKCKNINKQTVPKG